ncbi:MAG: glycosyltransferase family 39 protein, partial [Nitrososphaera sp.]|uniref:glycosyltransferase family 39 protein n=1 Tax=Nitrososphaera sp. TaxID=1971748 RepID=UPI003D700604
MLFYACVVVIFCHLLARSGASRHLALLLTAGFAFLPNVLHWSQYYYAETAMLYYAVATTGYMFLYLREQEVKWLYVSALAGGFLTQTKVEGVFFVIPAAFALAAGCVRNRNFQLVRRAAVYVVVVGVIFAPWWIAQRFVLGVQGGVSQIAVRDVLEQVAYLPKVATVFISWLSTMEYMGAYVFLFPCAALVVGLNMRQYVGRLASAYLLGATLFSVVPYVIFFLTMPIWLIEHTFGRYFIVFTGLVYFVVALEAIRLALTPRGDSGQMVATACLLTWFGAVLTFWLLPDISSRLAPKAHAEYA